MSLSAQKKPQSREEAVADADALNTLLSASVPDWSDYVDALQEKERRNGIDSLNEAEINVMSAYQFYVCINSSGLLAYFDIQTIWAQFGYRAMQAIGLPEYANVIRNVFAYLGLPENAKEADIAARTKKKFDADPDELMNAFAPLEEVFFHGPSVESSVISYLRNVHATLSNSPQQNNRAIEKSQ